MYIKTLDIIGHNASNILEGNTVIISRAIPQSPKTTTVTLIRNLLGVPSKNHPQLSTFFITTPFFGFLAGILARLFF